MYLYFENKKQSCSAQSVIEVCSLNPAMEQMTFNKEPSKGEPDCFQPLLASLPY